MFKLQIPFFRMRLYDDIFNVISVQKWWIDNNLCYFINVLSNAIHSIKNLFLSLLYLNIMFNLNKAIKLILHKIYIKPTTDWKNDKIWYLVSQIKHYIDLFFRKRNILSFQNDEVIFSITISTLHIRPC